MERSLVGVNKRDRVRNTDLRKRTGTIDVAYKIKKLKWKYAGHLARMDNQRWGKLVTEWIPYDKKRRKGRPTARCKDGITKITGTMWERVAYNRSGWPVAGKFYAQNWAG